MYTAGAADALVVNLLLQQQAAVGSRVDLSEETGTNGAPIAPATKTLKQQQQIYIIGVETRGQHWNMCDDLNWCGG